jgi:hypothetical protein
MVHGEGRYRPGAWLGGGSGVAARQRLRGSKAKGKKQKAKILAVIGPLAARIFAFCLLLFALVLAT